MARSPVVAQQQALGAARCGRIATPHVLICVCVRVHRRCYPFVLRHAQGIAAGLQDQLRQPGAHQGNGQALPLPSPLPSAAASQPPQQQQSRWGGWGPSSWLPQWPQWSMFGRGRGQAAQPDAAAHQGAAGSVAASQGSGEAVSGQPAGEAAGGAAPVALVDIQGPLEVTLLNVFLEALFDTDCRDFDGARGRRAWRGQGTGRSRAASRSDSATFCVCTACRPRDRRRDELGAGRGQRAAQGAAQGTGHLPDPPQGDALTLARGEDCPVAREWLEPACRARHALGPQAYAAVKRAQHELGRLYETLADLVIERRPALLREDDEAEDAQQRARPCKPRNGLSGPSPAVANLWTCLARLKDPHTGACHVAARALRPPGRPAPTHRSVRASPAAAAAGAWMTREQLVPEIGALLMAGFDTSSHTIAWCLFTLAAHPEVQDDVHRELASLGLLHGELEGAPQLSSGLTHTAVRTTRRQGSAAHASMRPMPQARACRRASPPWTTWRACRRWPAWWTRPCASSPSPPPPRSGAHGSPPTRHAAGLDSPTVLQGAVHPPAVAGRREVSTPVRVGGYKLPPGVIVWPMVYALHNAEHNWSAPHMFKPERWRYKHSPAGHASSAAAAAAAEGGEGVESAARSSRAFLPFSDGIKNCLGQVSGGGEAAAHARRRPERREQQLPSGRASDAHCRAEPGPDGSARRAGGAAEPLPLQPAAGRRQQGAGAATAECGFTEGGRSDKQQNHVRATRPAARRCYRAWSCR